VSGKNVWGKKKPRHGKKGQLAGLLGRSTQGRQPGTTLEKKRNKPIQ